MDLSTFTSLLALRAARGAERSARTRTTTERRASIAARFLATLRADCAAQDSYGTALPLRALATAWCQEHYPAAEGRLTPEATLEAQIRVAAKAGALPADVVIVSAELNRDEGRAFITTITINEPADGPLSTISEERLRSE